MCGNHTVRSAIMPIRVHNFGGVIGWNAKKYLPRISSESYLKLQFISRRKSQKNYIDFFFRPEGGAAASRGESGDGKPL